MVAAAARQLYGTRKCVRTVCSRGRQRKCASRAARLAGLTSLHHSSVDSAPLMKTKRHAPHSLMFHFNWSTVR